MCMYCKPLLKAIDAYIKKADDDLADTLDEEGFEHASKTVDYINDVEDGIADALTVQTALVSSAISQSKDLEQFRRIWGKLKNTDTADKDIAAVMVEQLQKFLPQYAGYYIKRTDRELVFSRLSKRAEFWINDWAEDLGELMKLNSHNQIQAIYDKGLKEGIGIEEFSRMIEESGIRDERYKARRCAITEILTAHRVAQQEAFMQSPSVEEKAWLHTGAYRNEPRENHVAMSGQTVPISSPFVLEGADGETYYPMIPGDTSLPAGERINCHCICQPIVNEDVLGLSLEERKALQQKALDEMDDDWEAELDAKNKAKAGIEEE